MDNKNNYQHRTQPTRKRTSPQRRPSQYPKRTAAKPVQKGLSTPLLIGISLIVIICLVVSIALVVRNMDRSKPSDVATPVDNNTDAIIIDESTPEPTPEPTPSFEPIVFSLNKLEIGDESSEVTLLQNTLNTLGFEIDLIDGVYGNATKNAVSNFQRYSGVTADGVCGEQTMALISQAWIDNAGERIEREPYPLEGMLIGVDPGHQLVPNTDAEPTAPGATTVRKKCNAAFRGYYSGTYEYEITLAIGDELKNKLEDAGATVIITHRTADVDMSNIDRAQVMNRAGVDLFISLHCEYNSDDRSASGIEVLVPSELASNDEKYQSSLDLAQTVMMTVADQMDAFAEGVKYYDDMTILNWSEMPVFVFEMGYLSNRTDDTNLSNTQYQLDMAEAIADGIVRYAQGEIVEYVDPEATPEVTE